MKSVQYIKFLELSLENTYFNLNDFTALSIEVFGKSKKEFASFGLKYNVRNENISFYIENNFGKELNLKESLTGLDSLQLVILNSDHSFYNYTELPQISGDRILYFTNKDANKSLSQSEYVSENDLVYYQGKSYDISQYKEGDFIVKDQLGNVVFQLKLGTTDNQSHIDLSFLEDGLYDIELNKSQQEKVFLTNYDFNNNVLGIIEFNTSLISENWDDLSIPEYQIKFKSRSLYWQYLIVKSKSKPIQIKEIQINEIGKIGFEKSNDQTLPNGTIANVFTSTKPISLIKDLKDNPTMNCIYQNDFSSNEESLEIILPNMNLLGLQKFKNGKNEGSFFLPTIVYV